MRMMKTLLCLMLALLLGAFALAEENELQQQEDLEALLETLRAELAELNQEDLDTQGELYTDEQTRAEQDIMMELLAMARQSRQLARQSAYAEQMENRQQMDEYNARRDALRGDGLDASQQEELQKAREEYQAYLDSLMGAEGQRTQLYIELCLIDGATLVQMDVADYGAIILELYPETAPITVANFVKLVQEGFYDGLTFHRVISGFMIQGGDPKGNGTGGSSETIKGEFSQNGVENPLKHERGVISMARSSMPDSASSQFFIMHEAAPHLDGAYAAFGRVLSGIEVVDAICQNTPVSDYNGTVPNGYKPVITSVKLLSVAE